jgi:hypothetical protein
MARTGVARGKGLNKLNPIIPVLPMRPAAVPGALIYPTNRLGWLHKFCSLLNRAEVAREIGRDAMLLILAIAVQEDALKYGSGPIFFDSELQRLTGIRSLKHLDRIRQKAVNAGWLVVVRSPDGDQTVAQYWTLIPKRLNVFDNPATACVVTGTAEVQPSPGPCGNAVDAEQAVVPEVCVVRDCETSGESGSAADRCSSDAVGSNVGPPADAELEARAGSAGASPSRAQDNVSLNTPAAVPVTREPVGNTAAVTVLVATKKDPGIAAVAPAVVAVQTSRRPIAELVVPKTLFDYPPLIRQQAGEILAAYPSLLDLEKGLTAICRALEKIPYFQLRPLMNRYILARNKPGQSPTLTPSAATWCDEERWKEDPRKWEVPDQILLKKKT